MGMMDLGLVGQKFTLTNKHKNKKTLIMERLDRFFSNHEWLSLYPDSMVQHLPRIHSDHCPILLNFTKYYHKPPKTYRFETMWLRHPDFSNIVRGFWKHSYDYNVAPENFTKAVRKWNKDVFGNIFKQNNKILNRLNGLQQMNYNHKHLVLRPRKYSYSRI